MSIEPEPADLSASPISEAIAAGTLATIVAEPSGHHDPVHTHCENCGTKREGPWCHQCGQHDFEFHRSFGHVFLDALENFFHFDSKLFHNIVTLLFLPGRLTADFNGGKRAAQMPPFRLYLFVSVLFFFISFVGSHPENTLDLGPGSPKEQAAGRQILDESLKDFTRKTNDPLVKARAERVVQRLREANEKPGAKSLDLLTLGSTIADEIKQEEAADQLVAAAVSADKPTKGKLRPNNPGGINFSLNESTNTELARFLTEKGQSAYLHQKELIEEFIHALPKMLLVCLPFFALFTRVLFRKSQQVYLQHLVLALHCHTFIFLCVLVRNGWVFLAGFAPFGLKGWLAFGCNLWLVLYPLLMLRRLFANSWRWTIIKTGLLGVAYVCTLGLGFVATAIILFLLL